MIQNLIYYKDFQFDFLYFQNQNCFLLNQNQIHYQCHRLMLHQLDQKERIYFYDQLMP